MRKAQKLNDVINYFDSQKALTLTEDYDWYVETNRKEIDIIKKKLRNTQYSRKFLFGGHPGNGKSTELNKIDSDKELNAKYLVVKYSANDVLDINDIDIIDLLLSMAFKLLEKAEKKGITLSDYLEKRLKEMEGFFHETLKIEEIRQEGRESELEVGAEVKTGFKLPFFVNLGAVVSSKIRMDSNARKEIRKEYRVRITDLCVLVNDIILNIKSHPNLSPQSDLLLIIDDLDKLEPKQAEILFYEQGSVIGGIKCSLIFTIPISMIYSPQHAIITTKIGATLKTLRNIRLKNKHGQEDETTSENKQLLRQFVYKRMEENLIEKKALDMAIEASGGVFRTLVDMITSASDYAGLYGGTKIDVPDMKTALDEERANKKRALNRVYYEILSEIYDHKQLLSTDKKEALELLHALFALEYMNGEEWCDVHPLLVSEIEEYKKIKENEKS